MKRWFKQIMIVFLFTMISSFGRTQYSPFGYYGLRLGCGDDLDLTFTGTVLMVGGGVTYIYGSQFYPSMYNQQPSQLQMYNIQKIGITLVITGVVILIEESIRHSSHKRR